MWNFVKGVCFAIGVDFVYCKMKDKYRESYGEKIWLKLKKLKKKDEITVEEV